MPDRFRSHKAPCAAVGRPAPETLRPDDAAREEARRLRATLRWKRKSEAHRRRFPLCGDPFGRHIIIPRLATAVHHIEPLWRAPGRLLDDRNLISLCDYCHARADAFDQGNGVPWLVPDVEAALVEDLTGCRMHSDPALPEGTVVLSGSTDRLRDALTGPLPLMTDATAASDEA